MLKKQLESFSLSLSLITYWMHKASAQLNKTYGPPAPGKLETVSRSCERVLRRPSRKPELSTRE